MLLFNERTNWNINKISNNVIYKTSITIKIVDNFQDFLDECDFESEEDSEDGGMGYQHLIKEEIVLSWKENFRLLIKKLYSDIPFGDFRHKDIQDKYWGKHFRTSYSDEDKCKKYILSKYVGNIYHLTLKFSKDVIYIKIIVISSLYGKINKLNTKYASCFLEDGSLKNIRIEKEKAYICVINYPILIKVDHVNEWYNTKELKSIVNKSKHNLQQLFNH